MAEKAAILAGNWLTQWAPIALRRRLAPGLPMNLIADIIPYKSSMDKPKIRIKSNKFITKNGLGIRNAGGGGLPGALLFTHHIGQAIESVAATDSVFVFMGVTERLRQSLVLPMKR